jgi:hypothetical protein
MTREEAKTVFLNRGYVEVDNGTYYSPDKWREACVVISEWLEQEPSGDLISRQAVLDIIHRFFTEEVDKIPTKKTEDGEVYVIHKCQPLFEMNKAICKRIKALPSVTEEEGEQETEQMELGVKIALQGVKEKINNITEEMTRKGIDTKYFAPIKAFVDDRLAECEINEKG